MRFESHRLRRGRCSMEHHAYLVTTIAWQRKMRFADIAPARVVINSLKHADQAGWSRTFAYCLMPDHLHWIFQLGSKKTLSEPVHSVKSYTAHAISRQTGDQRVWQDGFHDHAVRDHEDLRAMARYVIANPLRAGLVERVGEYPWWDAVWLGD